MGEMRHMLLILIVRVMAFVGKRIIIFAMETTMVVRAIVEVVSIVMLVVMVSVLCLTTAVMALKIAVVVNQVVIVMKLMVLLIKSLNVMVVTNLLMLGIMGLMRDVMDNSMVVIRRHTSDFLEVRGIMKLRLMSLVMCDGLSSLSVGVLSHIPGVVVLTSTINIIGAVMAALVIVLSRIVSVLKRCSIKHSPITVAVMADVIAVVYATSMILLSVGWHHPLVIGMTAMAGVATLLIGALMMATGTVVYSLMHIVVRVGMRNLLGMCMVVFTLFDHIVLFRLSHGKVKWAVLHIFVMVGIIFVAVHILARHMMMTWVLIVMRYVMVDFVMLVVLVRDLMMNGGVMNDRLVVRSLMVNGFVMNDRLMMNIGVMNVGVMNDFLMVRSFVVGSNMFNTMDKSHLMMGNRHFMMYIRHFMVNNLMSLSMVGRLGVMSYLMMNNWVYVMNKSLMMGHFVDWLMVHNWRFVMSRDHGMARHSVVNFSVNRS